MESPMASPKAMRGLIVCFPKRLRAIPAIRSHTPRQNPQVYRHPFAEAETFLVLPMLIGCCTQGVCHGWVRLPDAKGNGKVTFRIPPPHQRNPYVRHPTRDEKGRRARRGRHGRSNSGPHGERERGGGSLRPSCEGGRPQRDCEQSSCQPPEARALTTLDKGESSLCHRGKLWHRPRQARRLRSRHRGHLGTHGLEAGPLQEGGSAPESRHHLRHEHLWAFHQLTGRRHAFCTAPQFLRCALLQSATLHVSRGAHSLQRNASGTARRVGKFPCDNAGQGSGAGQRHSQFHCQPYWRIQYHCNVPPR